MKIQQFLQEIPELLRSQLPAELQGFSTLGPTASLIKFHFGNRRIHYEIWVQRRAKLVEVGLHFEGDRASNLAWLETLQPQMPGLGPLLGPGVAAEDWTETWTRIHEEVPLEALEEDFLLEVTARLAGLVRALQPLVEAVNPRVEAEAPPGHSGTAT